MSKVSRLRRFYPYMLMFCVLYFSNGFAPLSQLSGTALISSMLLLSFFGVLLVLYESGKNWRIQELLRKYKRPITLLFLLVLSSAVSMIINRENTYQYLILWSMMLIGLLALLAIGTDNVAGVFINLMFFLAVWSILTFGLQLVFPSFPGLFPRVTNRGGFVAHNTGFSVLVPVGGLNYQRNFGLFWEPGAFQTFLNIGLILEMFSFRRNGKQRAYVVFAFMIAVFTSASTTGIYVAIFSATVYLTNYFINKVFRRKRLFSRSVSLTLIVVIIGFIVALEFLPAHKYATYTKLARQISNMVWTVEKHEEIELNNGKIDDSSIAPSPIGETATPAVAEKPASISELSNTSGITKAEAQPEESAPNQSLSNQPLQSAFPIGVTATPAAAEKATSINELSKTSGITKAEAQPEESAPNQSSSNQPSQSAFVNENENGEADLGVQNQDASVEDTFPTNTFETGRLSAFLYPLRQYIQSPIFGVGHKTLQQHAHAVGYRHNTFTPINWFAENGIVFGALMCLGFAAVVMALDRVKWVSRGFLLIALFIAIATEDYTRNAMIYLLVFWGSCLLSTRLRTISPVRGSNFKTEKANDIEN